MSICTVINNNDTEAHTTMEDDCWASDIRHQAENIGYLHLTTGDADGDKGR